MRTRRAKVDPIDAQIEAIYYRRCAGIAISVMDIPKVFKVGREAIAAGRDPEPEIVAFVDTIKL